MDVQRALATMAEPTRYRIVMLLAAAPRTVGEIATDLGALQPQTTKHLQALEGAGVITVHQLGRRRVAALNRQALQELASHLDALAVADPSEAVLAQYANAIALEYRPGASADRVVRLARRLATTPSRVWKAWTDRDELARWWAPPHFRLTRCEFAPIVGSTLLMVLREGDGAEYTAAGRMLVVVPLQSLTFELSPLDHEERPLFAARYDVTLSGTDPTALELVIAVSDVAPGAEPALAGLELGWGQLLDQLAEVVCG